MINAKKYSIIVQYNKTWYMYIYISVGSVMAFKCALYSTICHNLFLILNSI